MNNESEKTVEGKVDTLKHIHRVRELLCQFILELDQRAQKHDASKLESPEKEIYGEHGAELGKVVYGSAEHATMLAKVQVANDHHYANNRHHPQHWPNGVNDMTLVDLVEMLIDWKASSERAKNGNIRKSIEINAKKYEISSQLTEIMENTVRELFQE